jgi:HTH-type transcriptional regulator/antitoxin HigA
MGYKLSPSSTSARTPNTIAADGRKNARPRINRQRYGALPADALPRVIETQRELERLTGQIEPLLDKGERRTAEEEELCRLVLKLIDDYQRERQLIPALKPHELLQTLLEESGKRQVDLMPVFGSRSRVSDAVNGKREISKAQAKRLGQLFHLSPAAFI